MNNMSREICNKSVSDCRNDSGNDHFKYYEPSFSVKQDLFPLCLLLLIIGINTFVFYLVYSKKALRTVTNYILCSLALSDFLTGLVGLPLYLACNLTWDLAVCNVAEIMLRIFSISTVLHLLVVTMDRYLAIIYSLRYHSLVTKKRAYILLGIIWVVSLFGSLIQLAWIFGVKSVYEEKPKSQRDKETAYDIVSLVLFFAIPLIVMVVTYSIIFFEVLRQTRNIKKHNTPGFLENRQQTRHEWKAALMFAVMLAVFTICWLFYFILRVQNNFGNKVFQLSEFWEYILHMLRFLTSFVNPCLYIFGKHDFRKALSKVFGWKRKPSRAEMTRSSLLKTTEI